MVSGDRLRVEVLGPVRALGADGRDLTPAGLLQRRLLALLVLRRGRAVPADVAVDALWPSALPADPAGALQNHLSRLRHSLPDGIVESVGDGYRLDPAAVDVDADRLTALVGEATAGPDGTLAELDVVLGRWSGPAYPELDHLDEARAESARLDELRVRARELLAERRLAEGDPADLVAELTALVHEEPLRERPRALLMSALAATGRTVDALRAYDDFRRLLADELGVEPSPVLTAQHAALLAGTSAPAGGSAGTPARRAGDRAPGAGAPATTPARRAGDRAPAAAAPAGVASARLPVPTTSLVDRDHAAAEVATLVRSHRLVTLVGPGGVGKTRLVLEVGRQLAAERPDRPVVLCELGAADARSAVNVAAAALGIDARPGEPLPDRIAGVLGDAELVLLADNCEHVLEPVAELVDRLLAGCPGVRVVATSRERLRIPGEQVRPVPTLPVAGPDAPAVRLFVERARAVAGGFEPDEAQLATVSEIVRRLDGLPLAIELAAARLFTHDLAEVAAGLDHRFSLLTAGYRTSPRHESLGAAVSWSYGLLPAPLQQVFSSVAAFAGPFTDADAAAVSGIPAHEASAALAQLAERSLAQRAPDHRYVLLETLRAFGVEQLDAAGLREEVGGRHARHLVDWVEDADRRMLEQGTTAVAEIDRALPELHVALGWLLDHREAELAGRLVVALLDYGIVRLRPDVLAWAERVATVDPDDGTATAPQRWVAAAYAAWMGGDVDLATRRAAHALTVAEDRPGPVPGEVWTIRGNCELFLGSLEESARFYRRAIEECVHDRAQRLFASASELLALGYADHPATEDRATALLDEVGRTEIPQAAYAWYCAGETDLTRDPERARRRFEQALDLARATGSTFVVGVAGASKASIEARVGDPLAAAREYVDLIDHWRRAGVWSTQWTMLRSIAVLFDRLGRPRDAAVLAGAILATGSGHRIFGADEAALHGLGVRLQDALGDAAYRDALEEGAVLDGDAAVEHALGVLRSVG